MKNTIRQKLTYKTNLLGRLYEQHNFARNIPGRQIKRLCLNCWISYLFFSDFQFKKTNLEHLCWNGI